MAASSRSYQFGPYLLDPVERVFLRDGEPVALTPKCFDLLVILVENSGHLLGKEELIERLWPGQFVEDSNLSFNVSSLRKALGEGQNGRRFIETVPKKGFRFVAPVEERRDEVSEQEPSTENVSIPLPITKAKSKKRLAALAVAIVALLALLGFIYVRFASRNQPAQLSITSIAVLPLVNLSANPSEEYFADGMTDALIGDLAKIHNLRVISRTSSMHYKGTKKSLPEIARELNVDAVVEGTVQRSGDRVRIRAQLIHGLTDQHLWANTYERDMREVFELQSEIALAIARQVQTKLTPAEEQRLLAPRQPVNPKALEAYLQGRYLFWNKRTEENLQKSIAHFQTAITEDSNYALAYVGLADSFSSLGSVQIGSLPPREARSHAEKAANKALELDSSLAEAHCALGNVQHYNWKWDAAEQEFKRAIELNPSYANAHNSYANYLMSRGRVEESIASSNRASELDPLSLAISVQRGYLLENARRYDEAIEQLKRVIAVDRNHYQAHWVLGHTYAASGQFDQAIVYAEKAVELSERAPGALGILGMIYGLAGRKAEAQKILQELLKLNERRYVTPAAIAYVYIGLDNKDEAFAWLDKAYQENSNFLAYLKQVPVADPLRSDPRFADLVRRVGPPD
ncbi:MAG TPA: winged helix-turn-helix domain-containing protein [Pyrinomonadaceae bacterium]